MSPDRIEADYLIETAFEPLRAAEAMAGEQSSGTFLPVPGETPELKRRAAAQVIKLELIGEVPVPSLPGIDLHRSAAVIRRAVVTLSWPLDNIGPSLPNLMATVAGNLFELRQFSGVRLERLRLPPIFADTYGGPRFGIAGTRKLAGVPKRALIGTIIKPSVGLSVEDTADLVETLCSADIDFIKDDELQSDSRFCPFEDRARAVMRVVNKHADRSGKKVMFAFNITGDLQQMRRRHDLVLSLGGTCIMTSINSVGMVGMIEIVRHSQLPIHAHRNGWGYLSRDPLLGWNYIAWQKLWRVAGVDHMHVNGLNNKFSEADDSVIASARECLTPLEGTKACTVMPVFSSGQTALQVPGTVTALESNDLIFAAGGGILAHPDGVKAGVDSLREAFEALDCGATLAEYARTHPSLARALETYST
jgi:ribulose-bisphosphate carboxylase large chain